MVVIVLDEGEMGRSKELSNSDKGENVMAKRLGQSMMKTANFAGCSQSEVVSTYQQWSRSMEGQTTMFKLTVINHNQAD